MEEARTSINSFEENNWFRSILEYFLSRYFPNLNIDRLTISRSLFIRYRDETISKRFSLFLFFFFKKNRWTILIASILRNQNSLPEEPSSFHDYRTIWKKIGEILEIAKSHAPTPLFYSILSREDWEEENAKRTHRLINSQGRDFQIQKCTGAKTTRLNDFQRLSSKKGSHESRRSSKPRLSLVCRALRPVDTERQGFYLRSTLCTHIFSILILCSSRLTVVCGPESDGFASIGWNNAPVATQCSSIRFATHIKICLEHFPSSSFLLYIYFSTFLVENFRKWNVYEEEFLTSLGPIFLHSLRICRKAKQERRRRRITRSSSGFIFISRGYLLSRLNVLSDSLEDR